MSENVGQIYYEVDADTSRLVGATARATDGLDKLDNAFSKTDAAAAKTETRMTKLAVSVSNAAKGIDESSASLDRYTRLLGTFFGLQAARELITMAEAYNEMGERIRMATKDQAEYEMVQQRLLKTANETYRPLAEAQEVYIRTADALRSLGYNTSAALDITDSLSLAMVKNATSFDRAQSAIAAFSKAVQTGRVDSDTWQSILAAIPTVVEDIARASGKTAAEIRKLGVEGKLSARDLNEGLRQSLDANREAAAGMAATMRDAFTNLRNNLSAYLGEANNASGATQLLSSAIISLGNNIDTVVSIITALGAGALAKYVAGLATLAIQHGAVTVAARAQAATELQLAQAQAASTAASLAQVSALRGLGASHTAVAAAEAAHAASLARVAAATTGLATVGRTLLGVLGGPVGVAALLATAATGLFMFRDSANAAKPPTDNLAKSVENLSTAAERATQRFGHLAEGIGRMNKAELTLRTTQFEGALKRAESDLKRYERQFAQGNTSVTQGIIDQTRANITYLRSELEKLGKVKPPATSEETQKNLDRLRDELALAKLVGEARAKAAAVQRLGKDATPEERAEAEALAAEIYKLDTARKTEAATAKKSASEKEKAAKKAATEEQRGIEQNIEAFQKLGAELAKVGQNARDVAQLDAELTLNKYATPEQIAAVRQMAAALWELREGKQLLAQVDPIANQQQSYEQELANLKLLNEAKLLEDQRYYELKGQAETAHQAQMAILMEENYRRQSEWNAFVMDSLDALGATTTQVFSGILSGTMNAREAMQAFASTVFNQAIGALVEMGVQAIKNALIQRSAQAAAAAGYVAAVSGQVAANTALAAQAAFASTAAIPIVGPAMAPAAATAAATAAAGLGAPAVAAASSSFAGRQYGGDVAAGSLYRINETGAPEVYNAANGRQYMLPNQRGEVVPAGDGAGGGVTMNVSIVVDMGSGTSSTTSSSNASTDALAIANSVRVVVVDQLQREMQQGGMIREFVQNGGR